MTPEEAYRKAMKAGKRLPELENIVLTNAYISYRYARWVIKSRWLEAEDIILTDLSAVFWYAYTVIKGRWSEAEALIMTSQRYSCFYAIHVIQGRLPEKMHNMMLLHAIKDSNNFYVKKYFRFIK